MKLYERKSNPDCEMRRVVISKVARGLNTYVNSKLCAAVKAAAVDVADGRHAVRCEEVVFFASQMEAFMPGGVAIKYLEFENGSHTTESIRQSAQLNRIYNYWEMENEEAEIKMMQGFCLQPLYKRPPPIWMHPLFLGQFGDPFLEGTGTGFPLCVLLMSVTDSRNGDQV